MVRRFGEIALALIVLTSTLTGCAHTGPFNGKLVAPGEPVSNVKLTVKPNWVGNGGKLSMKLPDGETFSGKYRQIVTATSREELDTPESPWFKGDDFRSFKLVDDNEAVATLSSGSGDTMKCRFILESPPTGLKGGTEGECQLSRSGRSDIPG